MRILMMADVPPNPDSGAAGTEWQTAAALRRRGHDVVALWADDLGRHIRHGNLHYVLELPRAYRRELIRAFRQPFDVVHVNQPHGFLAAEWLARTHPGIPFVHRSHGLEIHVEQVLARWAPKQHDRSAIRLALQSAMRRLLARHSERIAGAATGHIVSSSADRDFLIEHTNTDSRRIAVIPQAAPDEFLSTPLAACTELRSRTVLHVGQFTFFKGPMVVAGIMNSLAERDEAFRFIWVCSREHHAAVRSLLTPATAARTELLDWMPQHDLLSIYDRAGVFLFPSYFEGFGKAFLEAMSRGVAVFASDVGGARDVITHGVDGFLLPPGDAQPFVQRVLAERARIDEVGAAAARTARDLTWDRVARETEAFYERLRALLATGTRG